MSRRYIHSVPSERRKCVPARTEQAGGTIMSCPPRQTPKPSPACSFLLVFFPCVQKNVPVCTPLYMSHVRQTNTYMFCYRHPSWGFVTLSWHTQSLKNAPRQQNAMPHGSLSVLSCLVSCSHAWVGRQAHPVPACLSRPFVTLGTCPSKEPACVQMPG